MVVLKWKRLDPQTTLGVLGEIEVVKISSRKLNSDKYYFKLHWLLPDVNSTDPDAYSDFAAACAYANRTVDSWVARCGL